MNSIKACTHCGNEYPTTIEFFGLRRDSKHGLTSWCRKCIAQRAIEIRLRKGGKPAKYVQRKDGWVQCTKCEEWYPETAEYFKRNKRIKGGFQSWCKACSSQYLKERRIANPEKVKEEKKREYEKHKAAYRAANIEYKRTHREELRIYWREYKRDPVQSLIRLQRRLARKRHLPDTFTEAEWLSCLEYFNHQCAVCGTKDRQIQMDHWIPLNDSDCPGTVVTNIIPLCGQKDGCNQSKGDKRPEGWLREKYGDEQAKRILDSISQYIGKVSRNPVN